MTEVRKCTCCPAPWSCSEYSRFLLLIELRHTQPFTSHNPGSRDLVHDLKSLFLGKVFNTDTNSTAQRCLPHPQPPSSYHLLIHPVIHTPASPFFRIIFVVKDLRFIFLFFCFFFFFRAHPWHMEGPRLGVQSEL